GRSAPSVLGRRPIGSRGTPSRPARTRLLALPSARRAVQDARISSAAFSVSAGSSASTPLRLVMTAVMLIVPGRLSCDEAVMVPLMGGGATRAVRENVLVAPGPPKWSPWMPALFRTVELHGPPPRPIL